jgi:hypothetical protein
MPIEALRSVRACMRSGAGPSLELGPISARRRSRQTSAAELHARRTTSGTSQIGFGSTSWPVERGPDNCDCTPPPATSVANRTKFPKRQIDLPSRSDNNETRAPNETPGSWRRRPPDSGNSGRRRRLEALPERRRPQRSAALPAAGGSWRAHDAVRARRCRSSS